MKQSPKLCLQKQEFQSELSTLFKTTNGDPFVLTPSQIDVFNAILNRDIKWLWLSAPTRFGKSDVLSMALLVLAAIRKIKVAIVGGSMEKANKIMEYVLSHIGDDPLFQAGLLDLEDIKSADRLKIMRSKQKLRWSHGGWLYITSIDSRQKSKEGTGVVGEGADVVVLEEAGLITDDSQVSKVIRMPESKRGWGKFIMSGNMIERSVFEKAYHSPLYTKVKISLEQAKLERGWTDKELEDKRSQMTAKDWKRYYSMEFPNPLESAYFKPQTYNQQNLPDQAECDIYGFCDPALGEYERGSWTAIVILFKHKKTGKIYEIDTIAGHFGPEEAGRRILALPFTFTRFGIEDVGFQAYFRAELTKEAQKLYKYIPFVGVDQKEKKERRLESLEPLVNTGQIVFKGSGELYEELIGYPDHERRDAIDALEGCVRIATQGTGIAVESETYDNMYKQRGDNKFY